MACREQRRGRVRALDTVNLYEIFRAISGKNVLKSRSSLIMCVQFPSIMAGFQNPIKTLLSPAFSILEAEAAALVQCCYTAVIKMSNCVSQ